MRVAGSCGSDRSTGDAAMAAHTMIRRITPSTRTLAKMSPSATTMIRADHTHVISTFHQFHAEASKRCKHADAGVGALMRAARFGVQARSAAARPCAHRGAMSARSTAR